jgi:PPK2 family polyphosphate:nucleotide phosphotransferase
MNTKDFIKRARKLCGPFRVDDGKKFQLRKVDPGDTNGFSSAEKPKARDALVAGMEILTKLQEKLYAHDRWSVLLIFQAMDAAGKDSAIKHVMSGVNPQGCEVHNFKVPSPEELDHDYLWRCTRRLPERGRIGIFNRSYYEETLVVRVHQDYLTRQKLPRTLITKGIWDQRFEDIRHFERYLARNGWLVLKFFLHVSKEEQKKRFLERIENPAKNWKFSLNDVHERQHWKEYMQAYEQAIQNTASKHAPWYVVPADNKWFTRLVVAAALIDGLASLDLEYPELGQEELKELELARQALLAE